MLLSDYTPLTPLWFLCDIPYISNIYNNNQKNGTLISVYIPLKHSKSDFPPFVHVLTTSYKVLHLHLDTGLPDMRKFHLTSKSNPELQ